MWQYSRSHLHQLQVYIFICFTCFLYFNLHYFHLFHFSLYTVGFSLKQGNTHDCKVLCFLSTISLVVVKMILYMFFLVLVSKLCSEISVCLFRQKGSVFKMKLEHKDWRFQEFVCLYSDFAIEILTEFIFISFYFFLHLKIGVPCLLFTLTRVPKCGTFRTCVRVKFPFSTIIFIYFNFAFHLLLSSHCTVVFSLIQDNTPGWKIKTF